MSYKLTYVLIRFGGVPNQGLTLTGKNGQVYGHMVYEKQYAGHVLRMPQADWEAGADENILKRTNRAAAVIRVRVEVDVDDESREGQLEQELDVQKTRVTELEAEVARALRERDAVAADLTTIKAMLEQPTTPPENDYVRHLKGLEVDNAHLVEAETAANTAPTPETHEAQGAPGLPAELSPSGGQVDLRVMDETRAIFETAPPEEPPAQTRDEVLDAHKARLEEMGYPAMLLEAKELNATANAGIDTAIKTKLGIRAALVTWYEQHPN